MTHLAYATAVTFPPSQSGRCPPGLPGTGEGASAEAPAGEGRRWGLGDCVAGAAVGFVAAQVLYLVVELAWTGGRLSHGRLPPMGKTETLVATAADLVGLWFGLAGSAYLACRSKGSGSMARDFGLVLRPRDVPVGLAVGVGGQLILVPLLYLPWEAVNHHLSKELSKPAQQLAGGYHGVELAIIGVLVSVGAPIVEELYFRGLLLRSLVNRLQPMWGLQWGVIGSVVIDALLFGLAHFEPLQFLGLAAFGVVLAVVARWSGRIGPTIFAHAAFNAVTVIALATIR